MGPPASSKKKNKPVAVLELRDYQREALDAVYDWFVNNEGNPCLVMPTGSGKSVIIAQFCKEQLQAHRGIRILILAPTRELVQQNSSKLRDIWANVPMGVYSAALRRKELYEPITVANIHSIYDKAGIMPVIDILLVDEAHLLPNNDTGMYRELFRELKIRNPALVVIGLTATPYRLGQGMLTQGEDALFDDLVESVTVGELIRAGWLSPLKSKGTELKYDLAGVHKRGGEFVEAELQRAVNTRSNNAAVAEEIVEIARLHNRKAILVFCTGIEHAQEMAQSLAANGISSAVVTGKTPAAERARIFSDFTSGVHTALCNVAIATTGFDYPDIDLVALTRPTMSKGLYEQMAGRGLRLKSHTEYCIIMDFAGNVERHGPITVYEEVEPPKKGGGDAPTKTCQGCNEIVFAGCGKCPECGFIFPAPNKTKGGHLRDDDIMGDALATPKVMQVKSWHWWKHTSKKTQKEMLAVKYTGIYLGDDVTEYLTVAHDGFAGTNSVRTLRHMMRDAGEPGLPNCETLEEAAAKLNRVRPPSEIEYRMEGKFPRMIRRSFGDFAKAEEVPPSDFDNIQAYDGRAPMPRPSSDWNNDDIPF